jgi:hypothetical protein
VTAQPVVSISEIFHGEIREGVMSEGVMSVR